VIKAAASGPRRPDRPRTPPETVAPGNQWKPYYKVDLEKAKALLARAGYPNGFEATVLTSAHPHHVRQRPGGAGQPQADRHQPQVESVEYAPWVQRWQKKEFEATLNTTGGYADPDAAFYRAFHTKAQNWNSINYPELDRLLDDGRSVFEVEKRKPIYDKVQLQLLEKPAHLFLFSGEMIDVTQKIVQGFSQHPTTTLWNYHNVWLDG
jgi:peptide/nickel transport system substrate-binding protein